MTYIVVLVLTLTSGNFIQENATAASFAECKAKIVEWVKDKRGARADGSTFITGCIKK